MPTLLLLAFVASHGCGSEAAAGPRAPAETARPAPEDELSELERDLRDGNKFVRKDAVEALAERAESEAWSLLVDALEDRAGEVADSAAYLLQGLPTPDSDRAIAELLEELHEERGLGANDEQVRRYAAELLGRIPHRLDPRSLRRALRDRDAVVRRLTAWTIERAARAGTLPAERAPLGEALARALRRDDDALVRARALHALDALAWDDPGRDERLAAAIDDDEPAVRAAAALLCADAPARGDPALATLAEDPVLAVRSAAVAALRGVARGGDVDRARAAVNVLVERLESEQVPALAWRLLGGLQSLSGKKYGSDPRPWRDWVTALPPDWRPVPREEAAAETRDVGAGRSATLVGLPIRSRAVAFLIDFSGSAWRERDDGRTVKEVLDERLREALEALPAETRFLLVPYTGQPHPWREELVEATPRNVGRALDWFEDARQQGTGNAWDALVLAHDTPGVDTIVLLSDGAPSGGARYRLELITALFAERNLGRQVVLDCVLVDAPRRLQRLWDELARSTGGVALPVALE